MYKKIPHASGEKDTLDTRKNPKLKTRNITCLPNYGTYSCNATFKLSSVILNGSLELPP